eukprot:4743922-Pyramimonas_sp.AAC.1
MEATWHTSEIDGTLCDGLIRRRMDIGQEADTDYFFRGMERGRQKQFWSGPVRGVLPDLLAPQVGKHRD